MKSVSWKSISFYFAAVLATGGKWFNFPFLNHLIIVLYKAQDTFVVKTFKDNVGTMLAGKVLCERRAHKVAEDTTSMHACVKDQ